MTEDRVLSDMDIISGYFRLETRVSDDEMSRLISDLPNGKKLLADLKQAIISAYLMESPNDN